MSILSIYMNDEGEVRIHHTGFSWLAALALPVWLYHRGLYNIFLILFSIVYSFLLLLPFIIINTQIQPLTIFLYWTYAIVFPIVVGYKANSIHLRYLTQNNYYKVAGEQI